MRPSKDLIFVFKPCGSKEYRDSPVKEIREMKKAIDRKSIREIMGMRYIG